MKFYRKLSLLFQKPNNSSKEMTLNDVKKAILEHQPSWLYKNE